MGWQYDLLLNIVAEIIGLILSVIVIYLFIERYTRKQEEKRWKSVKGGVARRIFNLTGDFLVILLNPLSRPVEKGPITPEEYKTEIEKNIESFSVAHLLFFKGQFSRLISTLDEILDIHQNNIPPEILGKMLDVEDSYKLIETYLSQIPDLNKKEEIEIFEKGPAKNIILPFYRGLVPIYTLIYELHFIVERELEKT